MLYKHHNTLGNMTPAEVEHAFREVEAKLRLGKVAYSNDARFDAIKASIDKEWPPEVKAALIATGRAMSAGAPITPKVIMAAMTATLRQHVAPIRATAKGKVGAVAIDAEARQIAAEAALGWLLGGVPTIKGGAFEVGGRKVLAKSFLRLGRMVVDVAEVDKADVYVYALFNKDIDRVVMTGWATKDDLKKAPKGNRDTDEENCRWREMAHYLHYSELRPMSELLAALKVASTYDGILLEQIPHEPDLPMPSNANFDSLITKGSDNGGADFWTSIGVEEKKPEEKKERP